MKAALAKALVVRASARAFVGVPVSTTVREAMESR
jgi:hypothetical protein